MKRKPDYPGLLAARRLAKAWPPGRPCCVWWTPDGSLERFIKGFRSPGKSWASPCWVPARSIGEMLAEIRRRGWAVALLDCWSTARCPQAKERTVDVTILSHSASDGYLFRGRHVRPLSFYRQPAGGPRSPYGRGAADALALALADAIEVAAAAEEGGR